MMTAELRDLEVGRRPVAVALAGGEDLRLKEDEKLTFKREDSYPTMDFMLSSTTVSSIATQNERHHCHQQKQQPSKSFSKMTTRIMTTTKIPSRASLTLPPSPVETAETVATHKYRTHNRQWGRRSSASSQSFSQLDRNNCNGSRGRISIKSVRTQSKDTTAENNTNINDKQHRNRRISTLLIARSLFVMFLVAVAGCLGYAGYKFQRNAEVELATSTLDAITTRAIDSARDITQRKMLGAVTLKNLYTHAFPSADRWPYVFLNGFDHISSNMVELSNGRGIAFAPIVQPSQAAEFEAWIYNSSADGLIDNPDEYDTSGFGRGIFAFGNPYENATDNRYHDTTGETSYNSPYNILAPIIQIYNPDPSKASLYMWNYHAIESRGAVMDASLKCVEDRNQNKIQHQPEDGGHEPDDQFERGTYCGTLTDITPPINQEEPGAVIMLPIFPGNTPRGNIVGFMGSSLLWSDVLDNAFNRKVSGMDVVLRTSASPDVAYTYRVKEGKAFYYGQEGDFHDPAYNSYQRTTVLTDLLKCGNLSSTHGNHDGLSDDSPDYYLTIYPNDDFFVVFSTRNPRLAMMGAILIIVFTSLLFFGYDALVTIEMRKNNDIIDGRRRFMRFVSHEVRTPLNSVFMGLKLLRDELAGLFREGNIDCSPREKALATLLSDDMIHNLMDEDASASNCDQHDAESRKDYPFTVHATTGQAQDMMVLSCQILQSATSAIDILNDLLNYDKIETGKLQIEREVVDVVRIVDAVIAEFKLPYKAKGITLSRLVDRSMALKHYHNGGNGKHCVVGDPMKLALVFRNLLSNALKFTDTGGSVSLEISWSEDNQQPAQTDRINLCNSDHEKQVLLKKVGSLTVTVSDTGVGMSGGQLSALFKAGVQYNSNQMQSGGGSGLGLYIAKGFLKCHGGNLTAASEGIGKGSTFTVELPIYDMPDDFLPGKHAQPQNTKSMNKIPAMEDGEPTSWGDRPCAELKVSDVEGQGEQIPDRPSRQLRQHLKILVVDDCLMNRKLLTRILERDGHVCDQAEDGLVALDKIQKSLMSEEPYDSILLDYEMPNLDGPGTVKKMRELHGFSSFVVGITGNVLPDDVRYFKKCGADEVLPKPLDIPTLKHLWTTKVELLQPPTTLTHSLPLKKLGSQSSFPSAA